MLLGKKRLNQGFINRRNFWLRIQQSIDITGKARNPIAPFQGNLWPYLLLPMRLLYHERFSNHWTKGAAAKSYNCQVPCLVWHGVCFHVAAAPQPILLEPRRICFTDQNGSKTGPLIYFGGPRTSWFPVAYRVSSLQSVAPDGTHLYRHKQNLSIARDGEKGIWQVPVAKFSELTFV